MEQLYFRLSEATTIVLKPAKMASKSAHKRSTGKLLANMDRSSRTSRSSRARMVARRRRAVRGHARPGDLIDVVLKPLASLGPLKDWEQ
jgi:hypothetical protein